MCADERWRDRMGRYPLHFSSHPRSSDSEGRPLPYCNQCNCMDHLHNLDQMHALQDRFSSAGVKQWTYASWIIDRTPPNTTLTEIDSAASNGSKFAFTAIDGWPVHHFQCRLDGEYWYNCTSPETVEVSCVHMPQSQYCFCCVR